ncbi:MAG TPA: TPM domain-containing protein, partial [Myxococcaceae bacterium]
MQRAFSRLVLLAALAPVVALAFSPPPAPPRFLYDGGNYLSSYDRQRIEDRLMQLNAAGQQIGVAVLPSLDGESVEDATLRIAERWKPGFQGRDDGVVIAAFMRDRKMRIEVGYGLEGRIPDSVAQRIVADRMRPAFRGGRYADGIMDAIDAISEAALGRSAPSRPTAALPIPIREFQYRMGSGNPLQSCGCGGLCCLVLALIALSNLIRGSRRPRHYGFGQQATYRSPMPWWSWFLLGNAFSGRSHHHHHRSDWGSSGGGWGGGSG